MGRTARGPDGVAHPVTIAKKHPNTRKPILILRCIRFPPMLFLLTLDPKIRNYA